VKHAGHLPAGHSKFVSIVVLGWSIREEIERVRIGLAKQLLAETDLSVWKIAENTGFSGEDYLG